MKRGKITFERKIVGTFYKNKIEYLLKERVGGCYYKNKIKKRIIDFPIF